MPMSSPVDCARFAHQEGWITEEQRDEVIALAAADPSTPVALLLLRKGWIGPDALRAMDAEFPPPSGHPDTFAESTIEATRVADEPAPPAPEDLALFETLELSRDGAGSRTP